MAAPERPTTERRVAAPVFTWADMDNHIDTKLAPIHEKLDQLLITVKSSVPGGDLEAHRRAHEAWLAEMEDRKLMLASIRRSIIEWTVKAILAGLLAACWFWLKANIS